MASSSVIGNVSNMGHEHPILPNALPSVHPPSLSNMGRQEDIVEVLVPFHGSCSKCHHLHTNTPLRYFLNFKRNQRYKCENCHRDMFGLGNNSTQTTLASQETLSPRNSFPTPPASTNMPQEFTTDLEPVRTTRRQSQDLGTIAEDMSPAGRSIDGSRRPASSLVAESVAHPGDGDASRAQSVTVINPSIGEESVANARTSGETLNGDDQPQLGIRPRRFRKLKDKIIRWIGRWRGHKIEVVFPMHAGYPTLKISREPTGENTHKAVGLVTPLRPTQVQQTTTMLGISQSQPFQTTPSNPTANETSSHDEEHGAVRTTGDETSDRAAKQERIKVQRREKTEKRKATENPTCRCADECECRRSIHEPSIDTHSHSHSITTTDVPDHPLGHIWSDAAEETRPRSPERHLTGAGAWTAARHNHRHGHSNSWDSQASTAVSNQSSISLEGFRPAPRRSHSLPPIRRLLRRHGPVIRDALRDDTVHSQFQTLARQARNSDTPPVTENSTRPNGGSVLAEESEASQDDNDAPVQPHARSTSLANLAAPDEDGHVDHISSRDSSTHRRTPSPEVSHAFQVSTADVEVAPVPLDNDLPIIAPPNPSVPTGPDPVATETDHVSDGTSTPSMLRLPSEHRMTLTPPNHIAQPASEAEDESTPTS